VETGVLLNAVQQVDGRFVTGVGREAIGRFRENIEYGAVISEPFILFISQVYEEK
jgi:hypothetical protein